MGKAAATMISVINPKLSNYSRPGLLAALIAVATAGVTGGVFALLFNKCKTTVTTEPIQFTASTSIHQMLIDAKKNSVSVAGSRDSATVEMCVFKSFEQWTLPSPTYPYDGSRGINAGSVLYNDCIMTDEQLKTLNIEMCTDEAHGIQNKNLQSADQGGAQTFHQLRNCGAQDGASDFRPDQNACWTPGSGVGGFDGCRCPWLLAGPGECEAHCCRDLPSNEVPYMLLIQTRTTIELCPTLLGAGGQAAGYANYIELVFTILFVLLLSSVGVVRPLVKGALKQVAVEGADFSQIDAKMEKALEKREEELMKKLREELKVDAGKAPLTVEKVDS